MREWEGFIPTALWSLTSPYPPARHPRHFLLACELTSQSYGVGDAGCMGWVEYITELGSKGGNKIACQEREGGLVCESPNRARADAQLIDTY